MFPDINLVKNQRMRLLVRSKLTGYIKNDPFSLVNDESSEVGI